MGAFLSGFLGQLGSNLRDRHMLNLEHEHQANEETATALEHLAQSAKPEYAPDYLNMALRYRTLAPGKKPGKDMDIRDLMLRQVKSQPQGQPAQPTAIENPHPQLPVPPQDGQQVAPDQGAPDQAEMQTGPGGPAPQQANVSAAAPSSNLPPPPSINRTNSEALGAGSLPNTPSGGFSTGTGAGIPITTGFNGGTVASMDPASGRINTQYTPAEMYNMKMAPELQKLQVQNAAELDRAKQLAQQQHDLQMSEYHELSGGATDGAHQNVSMTGGKVSVKPDTGKALPGYQMVNGKLVRTVMYADGTTKQVEESGFGGIHNYVDPQTGQYKPYAVDKYGQILGEVNANPLLPSAYSPETTTSMRPVQVGDSVVMMPETSTHSRQLPGATQPTTGAGLPAPPSKSKSKTGLSSPPVDSTLSGQTPGMSLPKGAKVLGPSPGAQSRMDQNELTPEAQKTMEETQPVLAQIDRAIQMLEPMKTSNIPFTEAVNKLGYKAGFASDASNLINNLSMGRVIGAARLLKGSSRSLQAMEQAQEHLPNVGKDSPMLMYEKLHNIRQQLTDVQGAAQQYGRRFPGLQQPPSGGAPSLPPQALAALQEGHDTTFRNGQVWSLKNGRPVQVK